MIRNKKYIYGQTDITIPASINFGEYLLKSLSDNKGKTALLHGLTGERLMYDDILQGSMNFAVSLSRLGVGKGDVVGIMTENRPEFWSSIAGVLYTGATANPINLNLKKDEFEHVSSITKPKMIICSPVAFEQHEQTIASLPFVKKIVMYGTERIRDILLYNDLATMKDDGSRSDVALSCDVTACEFMPADVTGQSDVAIVLYSSGTSGLPKGVMMTHHNCLVRTNLIKTNTNQLNVLTTSPWFHAMGLFSNLATIARGHCNVYLPNFEVDSFLKTIEMHKIGSISVTPTMLVALSKVDHSYDASSLLIVFCATAPLHEETAQAFKMSFPSVVAIFQAYGMTEGTVTVLLSDNPAKKNSVGTVTRHNIIKVVDIANRKPLGPNEEGEICVKGLAMMKGYVGKDISEAFDEEGFYKTGDVGYYDEEGYFFIVDRLKELIKYEGRQVSPAELEAVLLKHNGIEDVGVVGVPDRSSGELPLAFVVPKPGVTLTELEVQDFVAKRISDPKHLRGGVKFIESIPRNDAGKILRRELRKLIK